MQPDITSHHITSHHITSHHITSHHITPHIPSHPMTGHRSLRCHDGCIMSSVKQLSVLCQTYEGGSVVASCPVSNVVRPQLPLSASMSLSLDCSLEDRTRRACRVSLLQGVVSDCLRRCWLAAWQSRLSCALCMRCAGAFWSTYARTSGFFVPCRQYNLTFIWRLLELCFQMTFSFVMADRAKSLLKVDSIYFHFFKSLPIQDDISCCLLAVSVDQNFAFFWADFHCIHSWCIFQSGGEILKFCFTVSHKVNIISETQVAERSSSDGHGGMEITKCLLHDCFPGRC